MPPNKKKGKEYAILKSQVNHIKKQISAIALF